MTSQGRLTQEEFVKKLGDLFEQCKEEHSIYITQKPYEGDEVSAGPAVLLRVTDGRDDPAKKVKFSTIIPAAEVNEFYATHYLPQLRTSLMAKTLRKRDKAKERKVAKSLAALKERREKNGGVEPVEGVGKKRGAGHAKRQRVERRAERLRKERENKAGQSSSTLIDPDAIVIDA
ncbi:hypothetical protein OC845_002664 [Tilletia horrida]|nr:hypothetical protein OC845_002664 [Tilletia horrida]